MEVRDSRRLPGPNIIWDRPSAVLDVTLEAAEVEAFLPAFEAQVRRLLEPLGWHASRLGVRRFGTGVSLALEAPIDALYAATEVNEWAFESTCRVLAGQPEAPLDDELQRLRSVIAEEQAERVNMRALVAAAEAHGVACITDDEAASIGMGTGSRVFAADAIPDPATIDWSGVHDIPVAIVTGTNGKSTVVRMLAAMVTAAERVAGMSSTDWIRVGDDLIDSGDWSGPSGARHVLRDSRVEVAVLETARGGLLRRGLGLPRADSAAVLNVGEDHLGEWGVEDLEALVETKFVVARAVREAGTLVLNADDEHVRARGKLHEGRVTWFTMDAASEHVAAHLAAGGEAVLLDGDDLVLAVGEERTLVCAVDDVPACLGGAARHNVQNALAAIALGRTLGLEVQAMARGLAGFGRDPADNPGRLNIFDLGGVCCLVDFAHNPHGMQALIDTADRMEKRRWAVLLGQAGDREDSAIRELSRVTAAAGPDLIVLKEMPEHLRGRASGEVVDLLRDELRLLGVPEQSILTVQGELAAVRATLEWAQAGDIVLLLAHAERERVLALLGDLERRGWRPGDPL